MPRWEERARRFVLRGDNELSAEITGIFNEWLDGKLANRGLLVVYEGFPSSHRQVTLEHEPILRLEYVPGS